MTILEAIVIIAITIVAFDNALEAVAIIKQRIINKQEQRRIECRARAHEEFAEKQSDPISKAWALAIAYSLRRELQREKNNE